MQVSVDRALGVGPRPPEQVASSRYLSPVARQGYLFEDGLRREHTIRVRVDTEEVREIDRVAAKEHDGNRSAAVRELLSEALSRRRVVRG